MQVSREVAWPSEEDTGHGIERLQVLILVLVVTPPPPPSFLIVSGWWAQCLIVFWMRPKVRRPRVLHACAR